MVLESTEHRMTDISSVASSAAAFVAKQTAQLDNAMGAAKASFTQALSKVESGLSGKPRTGFTRGPTYEAGTLTGQTKAAFDKTIGVAKSALDIKR
jgi:hypothetical protein